MRYLTRVPCALTVLAVCSVASAQQLSTYDDFAGPVPDDSRWQVIVEAGRGPGTLSTAGGVLTVNGNADRTGAASWARLGPKAIVEADALGYTGVNQILQLYSGSGSFSNMIEFGIEGQAADGTPTLHIWTPLGEEWTGPAPTAGRYGPDRPLRLRVERNGTGYRFLVDGRLMHAFTSDALADEARLVLYGFGKGASRWDNIAFSGPDARILAPSPGSLARPPIAVRVEPGATAVSSATEAGDGDYPLSWKAFRGTYVPGPNAAGVVTIRARATGAGGYTRSAWSTVTLDRAALWEPMDGQTVGPAFNVAVGGATSGFVKARFTLDGKPVATSTARPFHARVRPGSDGSHVLQAVLFRANGEKAYTPAVHVRVLRKLYGSNAHVSDGGGAFVFPDGRVTAPIALNDSYTWSGLQALWRDGDMPSAVEYVRMLRSHGVNVLRMMLEAVVPEPDRLLENPLGHYNRAVTDFWDHFLPLCERHGLTVLLTPWDTFWINQPWTASPYNKANGGPCGVPRDFIVSPEARKWQKARIRTMIDRWGRSSAIFAIDLLNEHDIWWDASPQEREAWVDDMAAYTRAYELRKWGRAHMLTVSSAAAEPGGIIADNVYRHPMFEFATTHLYYWGTVNDPKNAVDPALSFNHGIRYAQQQIRDGRPYMDSESGPIDRWVPSRTFDEQVFRHETWAHFASGASGTGMRWPYRAPHILTPMMFETLRAVAQAANRIDWKSFTPQNADKRLAANHYGVIAMGAADSRQAIVWVMHDTRASAAIDVRNVSVTLRGMAPGRYEVVVWDTIKGVPLAQSMKTASAGAVTTALPSFRSDVAITIRPAPRR